MSNLEFDRVFVEDMGVLEKGNIRFTDTNLQFKNQKTGKVTNIGSNDIKSMSWQRLGNKPGLRVVGSDGISHRFGGFKDADYETIKSFSNEHYQKTIEQLELCLKGWNYGNCQVKGKSIEFDWDNKPIFEIPCSNVAQCMGNKNEATLEFHQNDDCPVSLYEMRFHMPVDGDDEDHDPVEEFKNAVLQFAGLETETGQPVASLPEILCTTPRGRYDIKFYPNHLSLHGKTYDYKIPIKTITRLFLVPHKDGRHVYFVVSLNPPIRQGQTRYSFMVMEFVKEDDIELELGITDEQIKKQYGDKLDREMSGPLYEVVSTLFRVLVNMKVTVPGNFTGNSGTPAIPCSHKQNPGLLYPLEKGFLYLHKPPIYIRSDEVANLHFARSDGGNVTRTFDFEIELKNGQSLVFNNVEKEEYNKLFDYAQNKNYRIRNAKRMEGKYVEDAFAGSDDEIDPYKAAVKAEGRQREDDDDDSDDSEDEDYDLDADMKNREKNKNSSEGSGSEPSDEYDSGSASDDSGTGESEPDEEDVPKRKRKDGGEKAEKATKRKKASGGDGDEKQGKKKAKKDPNAPKRNQSAYFIWMGANRDEIKKDGDSVADVARKAGEIWRKMSAGDKKEWEAKALEDKKRYEAELEKYKKSGGGASAAPASSSKSSAKPKKSASGPSPSKAKSKEYISDSDDSDDSDEDKKPKKKEKKAAPKEESDKSSDAGSDDSDDSDSD